MPFRHEESSGESDFDVDAAIENSGMDVELSKQIKKRAERRARRKLREKQKQLSMEEEVLNVRKKIARSKNKSGAELAGTFFTSLIIFQLFFVEINLLLL